MSRLMSVAFTEQAVVERRKDVTRRKGWWLDKHGRRLLVPGDRLTLCRKVMGRKPGEPLVRLAEVEVVSVRREPLCAVAGPYTVVMDPVDDAGPSVSGRVVFPEMIAEGFPDMDPHEFMLRFFGAAQGIGPMDDVTRISWRYLDQVEQQGDAWVATCDHGSEVWYLERGTRHLARRSLNAHLRHEHGIGVGAK